ncbi:peptidoglycan-associated lipoprotein Pal [bacterium]|nr:MAG: peptidoglycan-associated lipoprotein Pal [bacterium]
MRERTLARALGAALLGGALLLGACTPQKTVKRKGPLDGADAAGLGRPGEDAVTLPGGLSGTDVEELRLHGKEFVATADLPAVRFDYDATTVDEAARPVLHANAEYLKQHPDFEVLVEGHCDERGTTEYNLALGQRRAKTVRDYYIRLGVPGAKIATISFGEERPACPNQTETCWSENRRAETKVHARVSSATTTTDLDQVR